MPVNPLLNTRSGGSKMIDLAATLCRLTNIAAPSIRGRYPDSPAILALLVAIEAVCALVPAAQAEAFAAALDAAPTFDPADGTALPGQIG